MEIVLFMSQKQAMGKKEERKGGEVVLDMVGLNFRMGSRKNGWSVRMRKVECSNVSNLCQADDR